LIVEKQQAHFLETSKESDTPITSSVVGGLELLPLSYDLETKPVLKKLAKAHRALAELKGVSALIPNENILLNTLALQEAKDSSAIENIITTHDELYQSDSLTQHYVSLATKEVYNYATALKHGYDHVKKLGLITNNHILEVQAQLVDNRAGFRKVPGTALLNEQTGEKVYTPPQDAQQIETLMRNLEEFVNNDDLCDWDPLIKMAVIHHQFESIHPFYDGNGRTGRILNILYLVRSGLLSSPILYLSRFINKNRSEYYRLLQVIRVEQNPIKSWEQWVLFMLDGIDQTSAQTVRLIQGIKDLMQRYKHTMRTEIPKIYSQDLLNIIFSHPYTKIIVVEQGLSVSQVTAIRYLSELTRIGLMRKTKIGRESYYINEPLFELFQQASQL